jgi:hypothetical protein
LKNEKIGDPSRKDHPFRLLCQARDGSESFYHARAVIDASGSYNHPRYLGGGGLPAIGERQFERFISYDLVDIERTELSGPVLVVGDGHSACTTLDLLLKAKQNGRELTISWVTTETREKPVYEIADDPLPGRKRLAEQANAIAAGKYKGFVHFGGYSVHSIIGTDKREQVEVVLEGKSEDDFKSIWVNHIFANVGYKPDRTIYEELQVHECYASQGPMKLSASLMEKDGEDCLDDPPADDDLLSNPEPNFYIIGAKSYGRTSNFLIRNCYDQIESVLKLMGGLKSTRSYAR